MSISNFFRTIDLDDMGRLTRRGEVSHYDCEGGLRRPNGYDEYDSFEDDKRRPPRLRPMARCAWMCRVFCVIIVVCIVVIATSAAVSVLAPSTSLFFVSAPARTPPPVPATLRRFQLLKRARSPEQGADLETLRRLFPHWGAEEAAAPSTRDLSLAVATLANRLPGDPGGRIFERYE